MWPRKSVRRGTTRARRREREEPEPLSCHWRSGQASKKGDTPSLLRYLLRRRLGPVKAKKPGGIAIYFREGRSRCVVVQPSRQETLQELLSCVILMLVVWAGGVGRSFYRLASLPVSIHGLRG